MKISVSCLAVFIVVTAAVCTSAQSTSFTYQGKLTDAGAAPTAIYDFTFKLFPSSSGGTQIGVDVLRDDVQVTNGVFTVTLDFGSSAFTPGSSNYLEISVRPGASTGGLQQLLPPAPATSP